MFVQHVRGSLESDRQYSAVFCLHFCPCKVSVTFLKKSSVHFFNDLGREINPKLMDAHIQGFLNLGFKSLFSSFTKIIKIQ